MLGSVYALGAIGVTLIFGILRFAHFAHGDMMTLGAFIAFTLDGRRHRAGLPHRSGRCASWSCRWPMPITALISARHRPVLYRPLRARGAKPVTLLIASIGVTLMLQGLIRLFFGVDNQHLLRQRPKAIYRIDLPFAGAIRPIIDLRAASPADPR